MSRITVSELATQVAGLTEAVSAIAEAVTQPQEAKPATEKQQRKDRAADAKRNAKRVLDLDAVQANALDAGNGYKVGGYLTETAGGMRYANLVTFRPNGSQSGSRKRIPVDALDALAGMSSKERTDWLGSAVKDPRQS